VLYGDNAAGGVINIITKRGAKDLAVEVGGAIGSYETASGDLFVSKGGDNWSAALNANYRISDGYRENSDTLAKDVGLNLGYDVTERLSFSLSSGYHEDDAGMPGRLTDADLTSGIKRTESIFPDDFAETKDWYVQLGSRYFITDNSYLNLDISKRDREAEAVNVFFGTEYFTASDFDVRSVSPQLVLNESLLGFDTKLLLGADFEESELDVHSGSAMFASKHALAKESEGYYAHAELLVTEPLSLSAGFRHDQADYSFRSIDFGTSGANKTDEELYTFGTNYQFSDGSAVYASYAKSFRYPHLDEMFDRFSNTVNINLTTQTSDDYEAGVKYSHASGLNVGVSVFYIRTEDELIYNPNSGWFGANENLDGDSIRRGVEVSFSKDLYDILFNGSYTYRDTEIDGGQFDGSELPFVPEHQASLGAQAQLCEKVSLGVNGTYVGERHFISDFTNTDGLMDDYINLSAKLTYALEMGTIYLSANNILNEEYSEYGTSPTVSKAYYPSPKANFSLGVNFSF
jgi:iron complex outermembrane receptor protein